jgi:hypothetical protein
MNRGLVFVLLVCLAGVVRAAELSGTVTDPSGAAIAGAMVQLRGPAGERRGTTDRAGRYSFESIPPGKYQIRIGATGFTVTEKKDFRIDRAAAFDARLTIRAEREVVNVDDDLSGTVSIDAASNAGALVLRRRQLAALSDDPDELAQQLEALAGPAPGPGGGQIYIDGFLGGNLPPKSAIREVRVNANPFSAEFDRAGFGRIEIFTKPGSESFHGEMMIQYNNQALNARNPLLDAPAPPYQAQLYRLSFGGPLKRNKASFSFDGERREIAENVLILATLDANLNPARISESLATPMSRTTISPRIDYAIDAKNTLTGSYQDVRIDQANQGAGGFSLPSRAYGQKQTENSARVTETATISARMVNETRFQFQRWTVRESGDDATPAIDVQGAFFGGGAAIGNSGTATNEWELSNTSTFTRGAHTFKWGGRVRGSLLADTSYNNFAGTYTFFTLTAYQETLALERAGYGAAQIAAMGFGASQFSMNTGTPLTRVNQMDAGVFVNDDWRARPNLTVSFGARYEAQTNIGDRGDWSPRVGIAWGLGRETVLRAGFGAFYDRVPEVATLNARRYNGTTQRSYLILNPDFFPGIPALSQQTQELEPMYRGIAAPRIYQTSAGIERQIHRNARISATWMNTRGVHLLDARNVNAPADGAYPFNDAAIRLLTESAGVSRLNQLAVTPNFNYKRVVVFGFYALSFGMDDTSCVPTAGYAPAGCAPADPYNLRAEWGPSTYGDVRSRAALASSLTLPWRVGVMPFLIANSGQPYNITTGLDPFGTGFPDARPEVVAGACQGNNLVYAAGFGCFDVKPAAGAPTIGRNAGRGPVTASLGLRVSRTWSFGGRGESGELETGIPGGHGVAMPRGVLSAETGRRYNLTLSAASINALNRTNLAPPNGDLSSPYFGESLGLADLMGHMSATSTYNRKVDVQLRFTF